MDKNAVTCTLVQYACLLYFLALSAMVSYMYTYTFEVHSTYSKISPSPPPTPPTVWAEPTTKKESLIFGRIGYGSSKTGFQLKLNITTDLSP